MAKKTLNLSMVVAALQSFPSDGPQPSQRALHSKISELFGVSPSFSTLQQYMDGSQPVVRSILADFSKNDDEALLGEGNTGTEVATSEDFHVDSRVLAEMERLGLKSKLELAMQQNAQLKSLLQELSSDYKALQNEYITRFQAMSKDFIDLGEKSLSEIQEVLMQSRADRAAAEDQWKGLRSFLYQEVDRIRNSQAGREDLLNKRISDLETRLYAETQLKNKWFEKYSEIRMRHEPNEGPEDLLEKD